MAAVDRRRVLPNMFAKDTHVGSEVHAGTSFRIRWSEVEGRRSPGGIRGLQEDCASEIDSGLHVLHVKRERAGRIDCCAGQRGAEHVPDDERQCTEK